ncbi:MAG: cytochrome c oxidase subunit II [Chromatiales bacterium]|nr:cytochrome c oxidase subunit II [Chromatiales bacterium]
MMKRWLTSLGGVGLALAAASASAEWGLNMRQGVTPISQEVYSLHMTILWVCVAIGVVVFGAIFWSVMHHRKDKGAVPAKFHESTTVEIVWTVVPFLILISMAIPATKVLIAMENSSDSEMTVKVTGYQWKWQYEYQDSGIKFFSTLAKSTQDARNLDYQGDINEVEHYLLDVDNRLVLPTNTRIRFVITSNDVIHSWWVPDFGWKKDAIPGFINDAWALIEKPGVYRGQCAELCGRDHGYMPIVVEAMEPEKYQAWVKAQKAGLSAADAEAGKSWTKAELITKGENVYNANCAACHQANGKGLPGVFPAIAGSAIATGPKAGHIDIAMNGKAGTAMSAFKDQLSDLDMAAVLTYQRNAFGNDTGDAIQPSEIKAVR